MSFGYYGFAPYVPVAVKTEKAKIAAKKLAKKGIDVKPIEAFKGAIAQTFWGKNWCRNLENYADFANRIARGRAGIRNGFVCHLGIEPGLITAWVQGSKLYSVSIEIKPLSKQRWDDFCRQTQGQIGSLIEVLQGTFSKEVMKLVCDQEHGLFPAPKEIAFSCSCPDYAVLCKHVAAVLYGVGRRLDTDPSLFFTLRSVNPADLLPKTLEEVAPEESSFDTGSLGSLFAIDLAEGDALPDIDTLETKPTKSPAVKKAKDALSSSTATPQKRSAATKKTHRQNKTSKAHVPHVAEEQTTNKARSKSTPKQGEKNANLLGEQALSPLIETKKAQAREEALSNQGEGKAKKLPREASEKVRPRGLLKAEKPTGTAIRTLQKLSGLDDAAFAAELGLAESTVARWKKTRGAIRLRATSLSLLLALQNRLLLDL